MARVVDIPGSPSATSAEDRAATVAAAAIAAGERACVRVRNRCGVALVARDYHSRTGAVEVSPNAAELLLLDRTRAAAVSGSVGSRDEDGAPAVEKPRWQRADKNRLLHVSLCGSAAGAGFAVPLDSSGARVHPAPGGGEVVATVGAEEGTSIRAPVLTVCLHVIFSN